MKKPPLKRFWYVCPFCGKRIVIYDNTAIAKGVFIKCKSCNKEVEIKINMH